MALLLAKQPCKIFLPQIRGKGRIPLHRTPNGPGQNSLLLYAEDMGTNYDKWAKFEKELPEDEEDIARRKLRKQKDDMSDKEVRRLHECWEQPEFRRMFEEYQEEVTDPKHRAETEEYLAQCEAEQRAGKAAPQVSQLATRNRRPSAETAGVHARAGAI